MSHTPVQYEGLHVAYSHKILSPAQCSMNEINTRQMNQSCSAFLCLSMTRKTKTLVKNKLDTSGAIQTGQKCFMSNVITLQAMALC